MEGQPIYVYTGPGKKTGILCTSIFLRTACTFFVCVLETAQCHFTTAAFLLGQVSLASVRAPSASYCKHLWRACFITGLACWVLGRERQKGSSRSTKACQQAGLWQWQYWELRSQMLPRFFSFLRLNNIPLYVYKTFCLFIHLSLDTWLASTF